MDRRLFKALLLRLPGFQALCRLLTRHDVRTLLYHRFSPGSERQPRFLDAATLRAQIRYAMHHHVVWRPEDHLAALRDGRKPTGCPVVFTVDDGYLDFYEVAFPIFAEHRIPAVLFLTTRFVDGGFWMWWDQLRYVLDNAPEATHELEIAGLRMHADLSTGAGRDAVWHTIADRCRFIPEAEKTRALGDVGRLLGVEVPSEPQTSYSAVTWDQVREMVRKGIIVGSHTVNHPILTRVPLAQANEEIEESKRRLEEEIGGPVTVFCYPQGGPADFKPEIQRLVSAAGFEGAYLAYEENHGTMDPYGLPRIIVRDDSVDYEWKLCGAQTLIKRIRAVLGLQVAEVGPEYWRGSAESAPQDCQRPFPRESPDVT